MQTAILSTDSSKSIEQSRIVSKSELLKNYDNIPVGVHFEGAPNFTEFPAADFKPRRAALGKKMKKSMSNFMTRTKKWWTGLISKKKISKPVHKSTTGVKLNKKPVFKSLKNRTMFNKSKKFDHWKNSTVLEKPIKEKIYVKDLPPAITIPREQLIKNFDEVPVGAHVHLEGAPVFGEFPAAGFKKKSLPVGKKIKKDMNSFMNRTKRWWSNLTSKKKMGKKPIHKSTTGAKFNKPEFKNLKKRTKFNKSKKFDAFRSSLVLEKPIKEKIYVKDLPPAITVPKTDLIKNFDNVPVGAHVHLEGAPVFGEFPAAGFKKKSLPVGRQIKKDWSSFVTRTKKWWSGLTKKKSSKGKSSKKRGMKYLTKFDKTKKYNHWTFFTVLERRQNLNIPAKGSKLITRAEMLKNYDEIPVGPHVRIEGATHFTEFPFGAAKERRLPFGKKVQKDMSLFMKRTKKWWAGLSKRKIVRRSGPKRPMWSGKSVKYRTMFNKSKKYNHWNLAFVRENSFKNKIYVKDLPQSQLITKSQLIKNYDEIPVGPHVHFEGAPVFSEFATGPMKTRSKAPISKKIQKDVTNFVTLTKKYWRGLQTRRIVKKGGLAMKKGMRSALGMSKRTKFDKSKKFDHWGHSLVLAKAPKAGQFIASKEIPVGGLALPKVLGKDIKQPRIEETKHDNFKSIPVKKEYKY